MSLQHSISVLIGRDEVQRSNMLPGAFYLLELQKHGIPCVLLTKPEDKRVRVDAVYGMLQSSHLPDSDADQFLWVAPRLGSLVAVGSA